MAFQVSPGVNVSEIDLTTVVPAVATTTGAIGGIFRWGPVGKLLLVDNENNLVSRYGKPTSNNAETFFSAANFLAYGNSLYVSRAAVTTGFSNTASVTANGTAVVVITGNTHGVVAGYSAYGDGVPSGAYVSSINFSGADTEVTLSGNVTSGTPSVNFSANSYSFNAIANSSAQAGLPSCIVKNSDHFQTISSFPAGVEYVAKYPGALGNSLKVSVCDSVNQYSRSIDLIGVAGNTSAVANVSISVGSANATVYVNNTATTAVVSGTATATVKALLSVGDYIELGNTSINKQKLRIKSLSSITTSGSNSSFVITFDDVYKLSTDFVSNTLPRFWEYHNVVDSAPGTSSTAEDAGSTAIDQVSVVVVDEDGLFTGVPQTILEVFPNLSRSTDAKSSDGTVEYYKTYINDVSKYIWAANDRTTAVSNTAASVATSTATVPLSLSFVGGKDGVTESSASVATLSSAYDMFADATSVDVSLLIAGRATGTNGTQLANYLIDNIAEVRKDCVVFISPQKSDIFGASVDGAQHTNVITFRNSLRSTSYAVLDSGYKYQYDKYNDVYRYIPLNGDIAGLAVRTDTVNDPWFSPAGFNRGQIKNIIKLAWNPAKPFRDELYKNGINPVVTFPGQGTFLYGDKTLIGKSSAFDRINVRRLFIVLEKAIATASNFTLFEFNDEFTRQQFKNLVEPFLRDVQGRRGIYDFRVVCDETNNTAEVIDGNRFVGDIYIKPAKSINFIQLNFVAVRTGIEFNEVVGQF